MPLYPPALEPLLDRIATHLATQHKQSLAYRNQTTQCAYRGRDGTSCAVGCLISDVQMERYEVLEGTALNDLSCYLLDELHDQYAPDAGGPAFTHALLCAQRYHDGSHDEHTQSYNARLKQYAAGDPALQPTILEDLKARYTTTRMHD